MRHKKTISFHISRPSGGLLCPVHPSTLAAPPPWHPGRGLTHRGEGRYEEDWRGRSDQSGAHLPIPQHNRLEKKIRYFRLKKYFVDEMVCFPRSGQLATCGIASKRLPVSAALWPLLGSVAASAWILASTCAAFALLWSLARLVRSKGGQVQGEDAQGMWEGPAAAVVMEGIMNYFRCFVGIELEFHLSQSTTTARTSPPPRPPSSPTRYMTKNRVFFYFQTLDIRSNHPMFLLAGPQGPLWRHRDAQPARRGLHQEGAKHTKATYFFLIYVLAKFTVSIDWSWSPQWKRTTVSLCWEGTHCRGEKKHSEKKRYMIVAFSPFFNFFFPQVSSPSPSRLPHPARLPPGQPPPPPRPTRGDSELGKVSFLFCF